MSSSNSLVFTTVIMILLFLLSSSSSFHVFPGSGGQAEAARPAVYDHDHKHNQDKDKGKYVSLENINKNNGRPNKIHDDEQRGINHHHQQQQGGGFENCLPKGFHRTSAPSRYINYQPLVSEMCSTIKPPPPPPLPLPDVRE